MPVTVRVTLQGMPSEAFLKSDDRSRFRDIAGHRMKRRFDALRGEAETDTRHYPRFASQYVVEQKSEADTLTFTLRNRHERFNLFEESTRGVPRKAPPFGPDSELADWARRHGRNPYQVARRIGQRGTKGHHILRDLWERNQDDVDSVARGAVDAFMRRFLAGSLETD